MSIDSSRENAQEEIMWGKPANDIINGIGNIRTVYPERGIWELVQNARDVAQLRQKVNILFVRQPDCFIFSHDGIPFNWKTLDALVLQTSSKSDTDEAQVGQYGTGFLMTHKFGLRFDLSAPLKVEDDKELYYYFRNFRIDRSATNKRDMRNAIEAQFAEMKKWQDEQSCTPNPTLNTVFRYLCEHDIEKCNVKKAFLTSPALVPYVMLLNDQIGSIDFKDEVDPQTSLWERSDFEWYEKAVLEDEKGCNGRVYSTKVNKKEYFVIKSEDKACKNSNLDRIIVILPVRQEGDTLVAENLGKEKPQLYIHLPLLYTADWGLDFILHSPDFTCDTDKRDNLRLVCNGQNDDKQVADNKAIIDLGRELIFEFIDQYVDKIKDAKYLVRDNFKIKQGEDKLSEYYRSLRKQFRDRYRLLNIVVQEDGNFTSVDSIRVLDESLTAACSDEAHGGLKLLSAIYRLLDSHTDIIKPLERDMIYWSSTVGGWYKDEENPRTLTIDQLAELISKTDIADEYTEWLYTICQYIIRKQRVDLFATYKIVPNEKDKLCLLKPLLSPKSFATVVKKALSVMVPEKVEFFIHPDFAQLFPEMGNYGDSEAKTDLSAYISKHNDELSKQREVLKNRIVSSQYNNDQDNPQFERYAYPDDVVLSIVRLYEALLPKDSTGFQAKSLELLMDYHGLKKSENIIQLDKETFDVRTCCTTLLHDAFFRFTLLQDKSDKADWCKRMVANVYSSSDSKAMLAYYQIYPDQTDRFKYADSLQKQPDTMLDRVVELYDEIAKPSIPLKNSLVSSSYACCFIGSKILSTNDTCSAIEKVVKDRNYNITDYDKQNLIVEIIQNLSSDNKNGIVWRSMFGDIDSHKGQLVFSIIKSQSKRDSIFQIMKVKDDSRLKLIASLAERDDLQELIEEGGKVLIQKRNEANDTKYKKDLGEYVEKFLVDRLDKELKVRIGADTKDEQGGQDIIIYKEGIPVYYIEIKSRWANDRSVLMSTMQYQRSIKNPEHYALTCANMYGFDRTYVDKHEYPPLKDILPRIKVLETIGFDNKDLVKRVANENIDPHVNPGYQILVPQELIKQEGIEFDEFLRHLVERLKE